MKQIRYQITIQAKRTALAENDIHSKAKYYLNEVGVLLELLFLQVESHGHLVVSVATLLVRALHIHVLLTHVLQCGIKILLELELIVQLK